MARIFTKGGKWEVVPHKKKSYQGESSMTKTSKKSNNSRRKVRRGQGKG